MRRVLPSRQGMRSKTDQAVVCRGRCWLSCLNRELSGSEGWPIPTPLVLPPNPAHSAASDAGDGRHDSGRGLCCCWAPRRFGASASPPFAQSHSDSPSLCCRPGVGPWHWHPWPAGSRPHCPWSASASPPSLPAPGPPDVPCRPSNARDCPARHWSSPVGCPSRLSVPPSRHPHSALRPPDSGRHCCRPRPGVCSSPPFVRLLSGSTHPGVRAVFCRRSRLWLA